MKQISTQQRGFFFQQSTIVIRLFRHQPYPPPPKKGKMHMNFLLIQFLLRRLYYLGDNENDNNIKKFGGRVNKVRYEQCKNVELGQNTKFICLRSQVFSIGVVYHSQTGLRLMLFPHTKAG